MGFTIFSSAGLSWWGFFKEENSNALSRRLFFFVCYRGQFFSRGDGFLILGRLLNEGGVSPHCYYPAKMYFYWIFKMMIPTKTVTIFQVWFWNLTWTPFLVMNSNYLSYRLSPYWLASKKFVKNSSEEENCEIKKSFLEKFGKLRFRLPVRVIYCTVASGSGILA